MFILKHCLVWSCVLLANLVQMLWKLYANVFMESTVFKNAFKCECKCNAKKMSVFKYSWFEYMNYILQGWSISILMTWRTAGFLPMKRKPLSHGTKNPTNIWLLSQHLLPGSNDFAVFMDGHVNFPPLLSALNAGLSILFHPSLFK